MSIHINSCLLASLLFACLVVAQQQAPNVQAPQQAQCNATSTTKPSPAVGKYNLKSNSSTCIVAEFAGVLASGQSKFLELKDGIVNTSLSHCEGAAIDPFLVINFPCLQLGFLISKTNDSKVFVKSIDGLYTDVNITAFTNSTVMFSTTQSGHYYKCNAEQTVTTNKPDIQLILSNFAYEAYRTPSGTEFYQIAEECLLDSKPVSDWVRIAVGICLIALTAIVLVAYFIARRRWSERSSYESV